MWICNETTQAVIVYSIGAMEPVFLERNKGKRGRLAQPQSEPSEQWRMAKAGSFGHTQRYTSFYLMCKQLSFISMWPCLLLPALRLVDVTEACVLVPVKLVSVTLVYWKDSLRTRPRSRSHENWFTTVPLLTPTESSRQKQISNEFGR